MNENKGIWIGVAVVVIVALGFWWWYASQGATPAVPNSTATTTTTVQGTTSQGNQGTAPVSIPSTDRSSDSVVAVAESIPGSSTFSSWFTSTGVASQLTGKGPYTIFVATDGAFSQLPAGTWSNLTAAGKKRFMEYYVVSGRAVNVDAQFAGSIQALSGDPLNFSFGASNIPMVDSAIISQEFKASNGVVYLISGTLLPPKKLQ